MNPRFAVARPLDSQHHQRERSADAEDAWIDKKGRAASKNSGVGAALFTQIDDCAILDCTPPIQSSVWFTSTNLIEMETHSPV